MSDFREPKHGHPDGAAGATPGSAGPAHGAKVLRPLPFGATPEQREAFLLNLADTGNVTKSALNAGIAKSIVYRMRKDDREFAARWEEALAVLPSRVLDAVVEEAIEGEPVVDRDGNVIGRRRNTRLLERLAEKHGIIDPQRPSVAVGVQVNAPDPREAVREELDRRIRARLAVRNTVIEAEVLEDDGDDLL